MESMTFLHSIIPSASSNHLEGPQKSCALNVFVPPKPFGSQLIKNKKKGSLTVVAAFGDVSADGTTYLIGGAIAIAFIGTAFPIIFSRKDTCPECDGAGFVRKSGATLRANAARKDQAQIVCARCNGLGKLNQVDK